MDRKEQSDAIKLKRYFAIAGLGCTMIAIILLAVLYRHIVVTDIVHLGERNNTLLAQTVLNSVKRELTDYLLTVREIDSGNNHDFILPEVLHKAIQDTMSNSAVMRMIIFNQQGIVIYSTKPEQIGRDQSNNKEFISAISGQLTSKLVYHDSFSFFRQQTEDDNLIQSYLPVRLKNASPILGVFEIYTDVSSIVAQIEHTEIIIICGVIIVLLLLYILLTLIVRRAASTIERQQSIIEERTRTLEILSSQLLTAQETEKKKLSNYLHEGIAQSLASAKHNIETAQTRLSNNNINYDSEALEQSKSILYSSIQEVRALAMDLRPPSLDDFGIIKTIGWLCREYHTVYPNLTIKTSFNLDESDLSDRLKTLVYRVTQEALGSIARQGDADLVQLSLCKQAGIITLELEDNCLVDTSTQEQHTLSKIALSSMKERTMLSGGTFSIDKNHRGDGTIATASWPN